MPSASLVHTLHLRVPGIATIFVIAAIRLLSPSPNFAEEASGKAFRSISLEQAYDTTLATDQSIRIAYYEIRKANLLPWSALTRLMPSVTGTAGDLATSPGDIFNVNGSSSQAVGVIVSQPIFDPTFAPAYHLGKLTALAARLQHQYTVRQTLFGVAQAYYNVLREQSIVGVNQETVDLAQKQLDLAQSRFKVGTVARVDVLRAQATLEDDRNLLIQSKGTLETNRDTLSNILNLGGKTEFTLVEPPNAPDEAVPFQSVLDHAYHLREDYIVSEIAIKQDVERRNEVVGEYGPHLVAQATTAVASYGHGEPSANTAVLSVQVPFLTGGQREIDLRTANHQISETQLNFEKTGKALESEVKNAWLKVNTGRESLKALHAEVDASVENYGDVQAQYEAGTSTSLDVQSALRDLNNSRTQLSGAIYDFQVDLRDLQRAEALFEKNRVEKARAK
jgi:outer membrane protein TolC